MKFLTRSAVLLSAFILPTALNAAPVVVDGVNCGELATMAVNAAGQVTITTSTSEKCAIGTVAPPPVGTIRVSVTRPTGGNITGGAINCGVSGTACTADVNENTSLTLTAAPSGTGYSHGTWGGDCAAVGSTANACELNPITAAKSVSATFTYTAPAPTDCPSGVDCSKSVPWPVNPQQNLTQMGNSTVAYKIQLTGQAGLVGKLSSAYTSGVSGNREIALSLNPGDFNVPSACLKSGTSTTNTYWSQGPSSQTYRCILPTSGTAYINIRHTNCPSSAQCGFYLKNY